MTKTILISSLIAAVLLATILVFSDQIQASFSAPAPLGGTDFFESSATVGLEIFNPTGPSDSFSIELKGPTIVKRDPPLPTRTIPTEILSMELSGSSPLGPVTVRAGSLFGLPPSTGAIIPQPPDTDFPADSFFDVFFEIEVSSTGEPLPPLCNSHALQLEAVIDHIPPTGHVYLPPINEPVWLHICGDPLEFPVAALTHAYHLPGSNEDLKVEIKKEIINIEKILKIIQDGDVNIAMPERATMILKGNLKIASGDRVVLVDNAGIGGTSDVEVTWRFSDPDCRVVTIGGIIGNPLSNGGPAAIVGTLLLDDLAFAGNPPHADVAGTDAILVSAETNVCKLVANNGDYVSVSTVGAS